eukprot:7562026-Prorocentrum_lima.AAC.1
MSRFWKAASRDAYPNEVDTCALFLESGGSESDIDGESTPDILLVSSGAAAANLEVGAGTAD